MRSFRLGLRQFRDKRESFDRPGANRAVRQLRGIRAAMCILVAVISRSQRRQKFDVRDVIRLTIECATCSVKLYRHATPIRPYPCPLIQTIYCASLSSLIPLLRSLITLLFSPLPLAEFILVPSLYTLEQHYLLLPTCLFQNVIPTGVDYLRETIAKEQRSLPRGRYYVSLRTTHQY